MWILDRTAPASPTPPPPEPPADLPSIIGGHIGALYARVMLHDERLLRIERALSQLQMRNGVPYLGLCVNHQLHPDRSHPHWDDL